MKGRVLIIAGSDSGGGAGIQADIKTVSALDGFAMTAITALTAQNTLGVFGVYPVPPDFIAQQMAVVLDDLGADALKTGMLHDGDVIAAVAAVIKAKASAIPLVLDPVMVAKGGAPLLQPDAVERLVTQLLPLATVVTPNIPEAEILAKMPIQTSADVHVAGRTILARGAKAVLIKGGHREGVLVEDILMSADGEQVFMGERLHTTSTHGTGCTLASAIATGLAQDMELATAIERARRYVWQAIKAAPGYGKGHGPLNHNIRS